MVLGIDAATFFILDKLFAQGKLPVLQKCVNEGYSAILRSSDPPVTFPAWRCISTGLNPGKLGVYSFYVWDKDDNSLHITTSQDFKAKDIWDYIGEAGYKSAVINVPGTFPPKRINGYMVSGHFAFDDMAYTYPSDLKGFLVKKFNYAVEFIRDWKNTTKQELVRDALIHLKTRFDVIKYFLTEKEVDFIFAVIFLTDSIGHYFWHELTKKGNPIEKIYTALSKELGELLPLLRDYNYNLLIVSDHGMCAKKMEFEINTWLRLKGYLHLRGTSFEQSAWKEVLMKVVRKTKIGEKMAPYLFRFFSPEQIFKTWESLVEREKLSDASLFEKINWNKTTAFGLGIGGIHFWGKTDDLPTIIHTLSNLRDPKTGDKIFRRIKSTHEAYGENPRGNPPTLILVPNTGYWAAGKLSRKMGPYDYSKERWIAVHDYNGIFIAYGPDVQQGKAFQQPVFGVCDVTPTIIEMYGLSPPKLDGQSRLPLLSSFQEAK